MISHVIIGCGDIGRRVAIELMDQGCAASEIHAIVESNASAAVARALGLSVTQLDFDDTVVLPEVLHGARWCYLVPPQKSGSEDNRSENFLHAADVAFLKPKSVVLISTTGVYGDAGGEWVDEDVDPNPRTDRAIRRLDQEQKWTAWTENQEVSLRILRVPGIYANSRIPRDRLAKGVPVVRAEECGFSNRIHADDLSMAIIAALNYGGKETIFNVCDGTPSKITDYLQSAAEIVGLPPLPEISMEEAENELSPAMLSYLLESRRIRNVRLVEELGVNLRYPDFRQGLRH